MPIRYCTATSKRTHQPCRARAMRGTTVCYHHGGKSRRGFLHPNYKHGFYCKEQDIFLLVAFAAYQRALRKAQVKATYNQLANTMPMKTTADYKRFRGAFLARMQRISRPKLTAKLAVELINNEKQ